MRELLFKMKLLIKQLAIKYVDLVLEPHLLAQHATILQNIHYLETMLALMNVVMDISLTRLIYNAHNAIMDVKTVQAMAIITVLLALQVTLWRMDYAFLIVLKDL